MKKILLSCLVLFSASALIWSKGAKEDAADESPAVEEASVLSPGRNAVSYQSDGEKIAAHLFLPEDYEEGKTYPAVVITPPASGVKEQTTGIYAEALSKRGFVTLAYDPRGWGESGGHPLYFNPYEIAKDAKSAVSFLSTLPVVDKENMFNMGICMGAGISAFETAFDTRVKALAVVSPYVLDLDDFAGLLGGTANIRAAVLPSVAQASQKYYETGEDTYRKMVPETEEEMQTSTPVALGMRDYYLPGMPGDVPNWVNGQSLVSGDSLLSFSVFNYTRMLESVPVYVAYGSDAVTRAGAVRFAEEAAEPEDVTVIEGAGHFDLYWMPEYVHPIADEISEFFTSSME